MSPEHIARFFQDTDHFQVDSPTKRAIKRHGSVVALAVDNLVDQPRIDIDVLRQSILRDAHWLEVFFKQDLTWVNRGNFPHTHRGVAFVHPRRVAKGLFALSVAGPS